MSSSNLAFHTFYFLAILHTAITKMQHKMSVKFSPDPVRNKRKKQKNFRMKMKRSLSTPSLTTNNAGKTTKKRSYKQSYICSLKGPILFTAPHSITVVRKISHNTEEDKRNDNYKSPQKTVKIEKSATFEIHHIERFTAEIALKLSVTVSKLLQIEPSFMIWNLFAGFKEENLDPNYTHSQWFDQSPWHKGLHLFKDINHHLPKLHIDIHGRMNRIGDVNMDIGYKAMEKCWDNTNTKRFIQDMNTFWTQKMNPILEELGERFVVKKDPDKIPLGMRVELDPKYEGFRGHKCDGHTMVHQSVLIGDIIAIQFELPTFLRRELIYNAPFFDKFAKCIADFYVEIVTKAYDIQHYNLFDQELVSKHINESNGCRSQCMVAINSKTKHSKNQKIQKIQNKKESSISFQHEYDGLINESLDIQDTQNLLERITTISKLGLAHCKGKQWLRRQRSLHKRKMTQK